ncbi:uncharacterized protein LOC143850412 [Tasmannia lanceolata]|uniref:uncharacterized protein LOC143850412 n=1 Tax=Tasmannia lanceolata TaxID=3420 RepID=UPI0040640B29
MSGTSLNLSSAYHPQSDGQSDVLSRCIEQYLRAFSHDNPKIWHSLLVWAEYSYNTSFQSAIQMTPFEAVYGIPPPSLPAYIPGSSAIEAVDTELSQRDAISAIEAVDTQYFSSLKPFHGTIPELVCTLPPQSLNNQPLISPLAILGQRTVFQQGKLVTQVLVQWQGLLPEDTSWENLLTIKSDFPHLCLEDKASFPRVGNDSNQVTQVSLPDQLEDMEEVQESHGEAEKGNNRQRQRNKPRWLEDYLSE